jgi:hypothetical protein
LSEQEQEQKQEKKLEDITRPEEQTVNEKLERVREKEEPKKEKKKEEKKIDNGKVKTANELLLEKYHNLVEKERDFSQEFDPSKEAKGIDLEKELGLSEYEISDKEIQKDIADYQKRRLAYFRLESAKDWHKIPIWKGTDDDGHSLWRLVSYRFHDYPHEVAEVIDGIRAEYEDATKIKTTFDMIKIFRDEGSRTASMTAAKAKHKWIDVGRTFILHMKDLEFKKAHKDFILLMIDSAMYRQETFVPNLRIASSDSSAEDQSADSDSRKPNGIA